MKPVVAWAALLILGGCAMTPEQTERLQYALAGMKQASDAQFERTMALNQQLAAQRQAFAPATVPTTPQMMVLPGTLKSQVVNGTLRYCSYSNGVVNTIASVSLCPLNTQ